MYQWTPTLAGRDTVLWCTWFERRSPGPKYLKLARHDGSNWRPPDSVFLTDSGGRGPGRAVSILDQEKLPWVAFDFYAPPDSVFTLYTRFTGDSWTRPEMLAEDTAYWGRYHSLCATNTEAVVAAWVREGPVLTNYLYVSEHSADSWSTPTLVDSFPGYMVQYQTAVAPLDDSLRVVVWSCMRDGGNLDLYFSVGAAQEWTEPRPVVSVDPIADEFPRLSEGVAGTVMLVWRRGAGVYSARFDGSSWVDVLEVESSVDELGFSTCVDDGGRLWATLAATDSTDRSGRVRAYEGSRWSAPMTGPPDSATTTWEFASAFGQLHVAWLRMESPHKWTIYWSGANFPGVQERNSIEVKRWTGPTILRAPELVRFEGRILDITGREVTDRTALRPGVYFLRTERSSGPVPQWSSVRKVILTR